MKIRHPGIVLACVFAAGLAACLVASYFTREAPPERAVTQASAIDRRLLDTARQTAGVAETQREQELAAEAARLADHELDQAYASAVREAAAVKPVASAAIQQTKTRIAQAQQKIAADQQRIAKLSKGPGNEAQLEVVQAQLELDQDELGDAQQDLIRQGGDERTRLEQARQLHADAVKAPAPAVKAPSLGDGSTLSWAVQAWLTLGDRKSQVTAARQQAASKAGSLEREHNSLEALLNKNPAPAQTAAAATDSDQDEDQEEEEPAAMLARLRQLSDQRKTLTELDRRIQDCHQLADTYATWVAGLDARRSGVMHRMMRSMALIFGVLLVVAIADHRLRRAFATERDRGQGHRERFLVRLALRLATGGVVLLIVFGAPSQTPAMIGLATAGLTVVLKDFVVAFFGWFVLMGRNGVRVGDWVEIKGVGGEVIEIGLFKTVLLEMGNWTNTGHPTGRRVSFMNGYAIEGVYFNFSTAGQWLWDELQVTVPAGADPYAVAGRIREIVEAETEADAELAGQDWEHITKQYGTRTFSAKPAVDLRPGGGGLEIQVRYITRGPQRYQVKSRLLGKIVDLLRGQAGEQKAGRS